MSLWGLGGENFINVNSFQQLPFYVKVFAGNTESVMSPKQ